MELVHHHNIRHDDARSINEVADRPESDILAIFKRLSRVSKEVEAAHINDKRMPKAIDIPPEELTNPKASAFNANSVKLRMLQEI